MRPTVKRNIMVAAVAFVLGVLAITQTVAKSDSPWSIPSGALSELNPGQRAVANEWNQLTSDQQQATAVSQTNAGQPAITPHLAAGEAAGSAVPAFTQADVETYLQRTGDLRPGVSPASMTCMNGTAATKADDEAFHESESTLVCDVHLTGAGAFMPPAPSGVCIQPGDHEDFWFLGQTGNLLDIAISGNRCA